MYSDRSFFLLPLHITDVRMNIQPVSNKYIETNHQDMVGFGGRDTERFVYSIYRGEDVKD